MCCRDSFRRNFLHACFATLSSAFVFNNFDIYAFRNVSGTSVNTSQARDLNGSGQFLQVWTLHERVERDRNANRNRCEHGHSLRLYTTLVQVHYYSLSGYTTCCALMTTMASSLLLPMTARGTLGAASRVVIAGSKLRRHWATKISVVTHRTASRRRRREETRRILTRTHGTTTTWTLACSFLGRRDDDVKLNHTKNCGDFVSERPELQNNR